MTITVELIPGKTVLVDDRTAGLGGSFYFEPLRPYSQAPLTWAWDQLARYPEAVLLDIGASTGCYSLLVAHHPGLTVWGFEPVRLTCAVLRANIALNSLNGRVRTFGKAVSDYQGEGVLHTVKADGGKGVSIVDGTPAYHKDCEQSRVSVTTIDAVCKRYSIVPTFIKLDLEGGERTALLGAAETIQKYHPFIICEYSAENTAQYGYNPSELIVMLEAWGYVWSNPEQTDLLCVHREWEKIGEFGRVK